MHAIYLQAVYHLIHKTGAEKKLPKANNQAKDSNSKKDQKKKKKIISFLVIC